MGPERELIDVGKFVETSELRSHLGVKKMEGERLPRQLTSRGDIPELGGFSPWHAHLSRAARGAHRCLCEDCLGLGLLRHQGISRSFPLLSHLPSGLKILRPRCFKMKKRLGWKNPK